MKYDSVRDFEKELEEARKALAQTSRVDIPQKIECGSEGITADFDLPYSSFPSFLGKRWIQTE